MKAIWTGSIGFGLVNIPVKLYSAVEESTPDLDMLDKRDHANIKFKRVNEKTGREVSWENIVKGYLLNEKYVVLSDKDFEKASPEQTKHVEITAFVLEEEIDSMYFEAPYFIAPDKTGSRAYALLRDALSSSKKAGLGRLVMRNREHLCLIKTSGKALVLNRIRFAQEIRSPADLNLPSTKSKPGEIKMAVNLINQLSQPFNIEKYKDEYADKLMKIIRAKSKGRSVKAKPMRVVHSNTKDLMEQLKASLSTTKKKAS